MLKAKSKTAAQVKRKALSNIQASTHSDSANTLATHRQDLQRLAQERENEKSAIQRSLSGIIVRSNVGLSPKSECVLTNFTDRFVELYSDTNKQDLLNVMASYITPIDGPDIPANGLFRYGSETIVDVSPYNAFFGLGSFLSCIREAIALGLAFGSFNGTKESLYPLVLKCISTLVSLAQKSINKFEGKEREILEVLIDKTVVGKFAVSEDIICEAFPEEERTQVRNTITKFQKLHIIEIDNGEVYFVKRIYF